MLTDKLEILDNDNGVTAEDIFEQSLFTIFSDSRNQHGEPGQYVVYKSSRFGDIKLRLADPDPSENSLFSHFLWNAGLQAAEMITEAEYDVKGRTILELGAGAGLPGILSTLCGATETVLSDYPADAILSNIKSNVKANIPEAQQSMVSVIGHEWGCLDDELCVSSEKKFDRIIAADCFWMDWQHDNLCKSIRHLLADDGLLVAIAGFHTGRKKVTAFFEAAERAGLRPARPIFERDVEGTERSWVTDRGTEDSVERKRWLTIAFLKKHHDESTAAVRQR